jgi:predicted transcriptional regulator
VAATRTKTERERGLIEVERLDNLGHTQAEIAERIGVSQPQVSRDLATLRERYRKQQAEAREIKVFRRLLAYRHLIKEAWEAWETSKQSMETHVVNVLRKTIEAATKPE